MKVLIVFAVFIALVSAFPSGESEPSVETDVKPEQKEEHKNDLSSVDAKPQGDHEESVAERAKRFVFVSVLPFLQPLYTIAEPVATQSAASSGSSASSASYSTSSAVVTSAAAAPISVAATPIGYQPLVRVHAPFVNVVV